MSKKHVKGGQNLAPQKDEAHSTSQEEQSTTNEGHSTMEQQDEVQVNTDQQADQGMADLKSEEQSAADNEQIVAFDLGNSVTGGETEPAPEAEQEEQSTALEVPRTTVVAVGIGQFCRYLMLNSSKTNAEILGLVLKHFPAAKTTAACIAWYKTDLRKKGLLPAGTSGRSSVKIVEFTSEELEQLTK